MKTLSFTIIFLSFFITQLFSQVTQEWAATYNGPGNSTDEGSAIAVDGSGNVYVTGNSIGSGTLGDITTIKYNSSGVQLWEARYNGSGNDYDLPMAIAIDGDGNVYVTGYSTGRSSAADYATIKYNSSGSQQWISFYNGPGNEDDVATSIAVDSHGNVFVTGYSWGGSTYNDFATVKYNSSGVEQWVARYNGTGNANDDGKIKLAIDASSNVYVTGSSYGNGTYFDIATVKYNSAGTQQWVSRYDGPVSGNDIASAIVLDGSGNVYVTGQTAVNSVGTPSSGVDYITIKYNTSGSQQWAQTYDGPVSDIDIANDIGVDGDGNVYVTGQSIGNGIGLNQPTYDYATVKYNSSGTQQWASRYDGPGNNEDKAKSLVLDGSGNVYITGSSTGNSNNVDYATIKYISSGSEQWVERYDGPVNGYDRGNAITADASGNIYVTGTANQGSSYLDITTIKYSQSSGSHKPFSIIPDNYGLSQNYPNPFNPTSKIRFALPSNSYAKLVVYDVLGKEIETLVNGQLNAGYYEVEWNANRFSSGMYFYKLTAGYFSETKKMLLVK